MNRNDLHIKDTTVQKFKIKTIITKKQLANMKRTTDYADGFDYKQMQEFIHRNKREFLSNLDKKHQINILTSQGWRSGKGFNRYNIDFYDPAIYYNDDDAIEQIYGIQIVEYP